MKHLKTWFANLKLQYKLMLSMAGVTTLALLAITVTIYQNYYSVNFASELSKSEQAVDRAATSLQRTFSSLTLKTSRMLLQPTMQQMILMLEQNHVEDYASSYQNISTILENHVNSTDTLISAYLFSPSYVYGTVSAGPLRNPYQIIDEHIWSLPSITYIPYNHNAKTQSAHVIPILYPVTHMYATSGTYLTYGSSERGQPVCLALFLDERYLHDTLARFSTSMTESFYLLNHEGQSLNNNEGAVAPEVLSSVNTYVMEHGDSTNSSQVILGDTYYITSRAVGNNGLRIVHVFSSRSITRSIRPMMLFLIFVWILAILASCMLSFIIAHFLTRPFFKLTKVIEQINHNTYEEKAEFLYDDESGLLGKQINQMYDTIQQQIELIKEEEQQKAKAEIQMYAEQVNPHFLYNTLECIHFQMLNGHQDTASLMINSLGKYLRLTLSHGHTVIPLSKELEHVTEYMMIINRHASTARITFSCSCDDSLHTTPVLKLLLQPLVENAIKHGYPKELSSYILPPAIAVEVTQENDTIHLQVIDNGQGFDIQRIRQCMEDKTFEEGCHFGLRNVYQRLITYYGSKAEILFESIPYYRNVIHLRIPK